MLLPVIESRKRVTSSRSASSIAVPTLQFSHPRRLGADLPRTRLWIAGRRFRLSGVVFEPAREFFEDALPAALASSLAGEPAVEDWMENLQATAFARDYHVTGEIGATADGRITALRRHVLADHGAFDAFDACADPTKYRPASSAAAPARTTSRSRM